MATPPPLVVGLTGQIGAGKSTAGIFFQELGIPVIDTDQLARDVVAIGTPAYQAIIAYFGDAIVLANGDLNRRLLRSQIFDKAQARLWLEQLLHPLIEHALNQQLQQCSAPYAIVLVPLLIDRRRIGGINRILVIDSDHHQQRVLQRDGIDPALLQKIIDSQPKRDHLRQAADDLLLNNGDLADLRQQVLALHQSYLRLASMECSKVTSAEESRRGHKAKDKKRGQQ